MASYRFKIILAGDEAVGKTSTILRFVHNTYSELYKPTLGFQISVKNLNYKTQTNADRMVIFSIWDIAGQGQFAGVRKGYYQATDGVLLLFDLTRRKTFEDAKFWADEIRTIAPGAPIILVGNKADLPSQAVLPQELTYLSKEKNFAGYAICSAATGRGVDEIFKMVAESIINAIAAPKEPEPAPVVTVGATPAPVVTPPVVAPEVTPPVIQSQAPMPAEEYNPPVQRAPPVLPRLEFTLPARNVPQAPPVEVQPVVTPPAPMPPPAEIQPEAPVPAPEIPHVEVKPVVIPPATMSPAVEIQPEAPVPNPEIPRVEVKPVIVPPAPVYVPEVPEPPEEPSAPTEVPEKEEPPILPPEPAPVPMVTETPEVIQGATMVPEKVETPVSPTPPPVQPEVLETKDQESKPKKTSFWHRVFHREK